MTVEDSGTVWQAEPGLSEPPRFRSGVLLPSSGFQPCQDTDFLRHLTNKSAGRHILTFDLSAPAYDHLDLGSLQRRGFSLGRPVAPVIPYAGDRRLTRSRWPNTGDSAARMDHIISANKSSPIFLVNSTRPGLWRGENVWLDGIVSQNWVWTYNQILLDSGNRLGIARVGRGKFWMEVTDRKNFVALIP